MGTAAANGESILSTWWAAGRRVIAFSLACAAVAGGGLWLVDIVRISEARSWRAVEHLEPWGRTLVGRLNSARSDLTRLGAWGTALMDEGASPRPQLIRRLQEFLQRRSWCRGILVAPADGRPFLVLGERDDAHCNPGHAELARLLPDDEGFLARGSGEPPRLCLGVAIGGRAGRRGAILAEVNPEMLLGGLRSAAPGETPLITDSSGRTVIGHRASAAPETVGLAVRLSGWRGPAAGTWRVSAAPGGAVPLARRPQLFVLGGLLLALALAAGGLARVAGGGRGCEVPAREPSRPGPLPVIDKEALERLEALDAEGTPGFLAELAQDFHEGVQGRLEEMRAALGTGDARLLESAAHSLKGSAGVLGARALAERCRQLERLARQGAVAEAASLVAGLPDEHASVMSMLEAAVIARPVAPPDRAPDQLPLT